MTNEELLAAHKEKVVLQKRRKELDKQIATAARELQVVQKTLSKAAAITDIVDGICMRVDRGNDGKWRYARTLADGEGIATRCADLYQKVNTEYWAVCINEQGAPYGYMGSRWHAGHVLGLSKDLSYEQVETLAKRWLTGNGDVPAADDV